MSHKLPKTKPVVLAAILVPLLLSGGYAVAADTNATQAKDTDSQKVYKTVGPNGEVIYSDKPSPGSKEIPVPTNSGYKPVAPPAGFTPYKAPPDKTTKQAIKNTVTITSPADKQTIRSAPGELNVSVSLGNELQPGQHLEYQIDGKTMYAGTTTSHRFKNIDRGTHVVTVRIKDESGSEATSQAVTFYMKRPFIKHPIKTHPVKKP